MFKKADIIIIVAVVLISTALFIYFFPGSGELATVSVSVGGKPYGTYSIEIPQKITVVTEKGLNIVEIANNSVHMENADCPDKLCVSQGWINTPMQSVVCLPNQVIVEIIHK